ncbi:hypothetical protein A6E03_19065 [Aliivibrio sp. 1S128]|nr:hypothetical protein A6E03_19065 [Aliivibrio sp. 1S128]
METVNLELWRTIFAGATLFSIGIAYFSLRVTKKKQKEDLALANDKEVIAQAKLSLKWAFESLDIDDQLQMPKQDRLIWLTAARHILRYYKLRDSIKTVTYQTICAEHEEYWRHKFYLLFSNPNYMFGNYFTKSSNPIWPENIEIRSAMILSIFSQWGENTIDPIDNITIEQLIELKPYKGDIGTGIEHYQKILNEAKEQLS